MITESYRRLLKATTVTATTVAFGSFYYLFIIRIVHVVQKKKQTDKATLYKLTLRNNQ